VKHPERDFGRGRTEVRELAPDVGEAAAVAQAVFGGDGVVDDVAVGVDGAAEVDDVGRFVVAEDLVVDEDLFDEDFEVFGKAVSLGAADFCGG
jgi:hypothetical protein